MEGEYYIKHTKKLMNDFRSLTLNILYLKRKSLELERSWYEFMVIYVISFLIMLIFDTNWLFTSAGICIFWAGAYNYITTKRIVKSLDRWTELDAMLKLNIAALTRHREIMDKLTEEREQYVKSIQRVLNSG